MKFKTSNEEAEYTQLSTKNEKLYRLLKILDQFCIMELGKEITITEIYRSKEENDKLYAHLDASKRPNSPHMYWKGADIRSRDFTDAEKQRMLKLLNCFIYAGGQGKPVGMVHAIQGNVEHFHLQY